MEFHPAANIFPLLEGDEFEAFKADVKRHGQRETIWTFEGKILDGRNRHRACCAHSGTGAAAKAVRPSLLYRPGGKHPGEQKCRLYTCSSSVARGHLNTKIRVYGGGKFVDRFRYGLLVQQSRYLEGN